MPPPIAPAAPPTPDSAAPGHDERVAEQALRMAFEGTDPLESPPPLLTTPAPTPEPPKEPKEVIPPVEPREEPKEEPADPLDSPPEGTVIPKPDNKSLRAQLEVRNTEFKKLTGEHTLLQEEVTKLKADNERLTKEKVEPEVRENIDYSQEPTVKNITDPILRDVGVVAASLGKEGRVLRANFSIKDGYLSDFVVAARMPDGQAKDEALEKLSERLTTDLGERGQERAMDLLGRSLPGYEQATLEMKRLQDDSGNRRVRKGVERYNKTTEEIGKLLDPLGEVPAEVLAAKPHTIEAFVSNLITSDPKWLARAQTVKKEIVEFIAGPKPLTPEEKAAVEANDTGSLTDAEEVRVKQFLTKRDAFAKRLFYQTMFHPNVSTLLQELETLRASQVSEDAEMDALEKLPPAAPPKTQAAPKERDLKEDLAAIFRGKDIGED